MSLYDKFYIVEVEMLKSYTRSDPPNSGTARKIWRAIIAANMIPRELHYNPNCWGNPKPGWGTWACEVQYPGDQGHEIREHLCGWDKERGAAYLQGRTAPYRKVWIDG
jgi:hypothetical protein